jgi:uncharacterized protein (UPF0548 family)
MQPMSPQRRAVLEAAAPTFPHLRATDGPPVAGYAVLRRSRVAGTGPRALAAAGDALLGWKVHERAGMRIAAPAPEVREDGVVELTIGLGGVGLRAPCRVVRVTRTPEHVGFAYVTLPGHPATGEEAFDLTLEADGAVRATVMAYSRPGTLLARAGGPVTRVAQRFAADRYLAAMAAFARRPAAGPR